MVFRYLFFASLFFINSCSTESKSAFFTKLDSEHTGITFTNIIPSSDTLSVEQNPFLYNGAGVAAIDINNNGYQDLFFSGNLVPSKLYLNQGDFTFKDITESSGINTSKWATGISVIDINNDGYQDLYISVSGLVDSDSTDRGNLLYINNGDSTFTEAASKYGIDDQGFTTHSVFFDYNGNGYPDLFVLNNSPEEFSRGDTGSSFFGGRATSNPAGFDQLYRNNGDGTFTNVSEEAGILQKLGYGLGVVVTDLNNNGLADIYVSNDITPNDVLYINNGDGTFTNRAGDWLRHTSFAGMGIDIADFTNNGWPDILQTDMMPENISERKRMSGSTTHGGFRDLRRRGFFPHYNINTLQMNLGTDESGNLIFSEIGRLAGVAYTHWSWAALFGDFDNDGQKDIFITNGYPRALNDFDYLSDMHRASPEQKKEILNNLHGYEVPNYILKNNGDLTFTDKSEIWGFNQPGFSYGAAYVDLDNNGQLDLVVNNINSTASVYRNTGSDSENYNYLQLQLEGEAPNRNGLGAKIKIQAGSDKQYIYNTPYRGFMSSVDPRIHFGVGNKKVVDVVQVIWPDGRRQNLHDVEANQLITIHQSDAEDGNDALQATPKQKNFKLFQPAAGIISYRHQENYYNDYSIQSLLPYMISKIGPPLAVGDVTGNGLDDVYIGGAADQAGKLFLQQDDGSFIEALHNQPWEADKAQEDWDALLFDSNGNGLLDLYVASGGYHRSPVSQMLQDRLYINHGDGRFLKSTDAIPEMLTSTATVKAGDFTGDGLPDLFVGGRLTPRSYPHPTRSYILKNENGIFKDVTHQAAPEMADSFGMITDAVWVDFTGDGRQDLVTVGDWMSIRFFANDGQKLTNITEQLNLPDMRGWWFTIAAGDFNNNGRTDIIAGNLGLNHSYTTSADSRLGIYAIDAGSMNAPHTIITKEQNGEDVPFDGLARTGREIYEIGANFSSFESYSKASLREVFGSSVINNSLRYKADTFASMFFENEGDNRFTATPLPNLAQISPIQAILTDDFDGDGNLDLLTAGNLYHTEPNIPRVDAGNGLWLKGDGTGNLTPVSQDQSGFLAPLDARNLAIITTPAGKKVLVANNADSLQVFSILPEEHSVKVDAVILNKEN